MQPRIIESNYPIPTHPTWFMVDNSKISNYKTCPRKYFYSYIFGWEGKMPNIHLVFGQAWHIAMEHLKLTGMTVQSVEQAVRKFEKHYRKYFSPAVDADNAPKNLLGAATGLDEYAIQYDNDDFEVMHTEVLAKVPISQDRNMIVRIDYIGKSERQFPGIFGMDYKTGQRYSTAWQRQWYTNSQMKLYTMALQVYFGIINKIFGMVVDGIIFYKAVQKDIGKRHRLVRIPLRVDDNMMNAWLFDINRWYSLLEEDMLQLAESSKDDPVMMCFHKNEEACTMYGLCKFHPLCCIWANPLKECEAPPQDFKIKWWNPIEPEDKPPAKVVIADGEIKDVQQEDTNNE